MLKIIKLATVVQALHKNFQKSLEIYEARMNYKVASIKIYIYLRRLQAKRGGFLVLMRNQFRYRWTVLAANGCL